MDVWAPSHSTRTEPIAERVPSAAGSAPELAIFVGLQAAGKSSYYREHFAQTHAHVSKDAMGNASRREARQRALIAQALASGRSVVVDNTNPTPEIRTPLCALGRACGARVLAYFFAVPLAQCIARNERREGRARVPKVAIFATAKLLAPPRLEEGFDAIYKVEPSESPTAQLAR
jgi:predicted kinase